jgi:hypothetical protein
MRRRQRAWAFLQFDEGEYEMRCVYFVHAMSE